MQRRRRPAGRHGGEAREEPYGRRMLHTRRAVRFYWSGSYHIRANGAGHRQVVRRLSIGSTVRRATPTIVQVEWTLAMLITTWMSWISLIEECEQEDRE